VSPRALARSQAADDLAGPPQSWRQTQIEEIRSSPLALFPDDPPPSPDDAAAFASWMLATIWNGRRVGKVREVYSPSVRMAGPGGRRLWGWGEMAGWIIALLATFPDARLKVDHVASVTGPRGREIAVRWRLAGTHGGPALYGPPSQRPVLILAITHWRIEDGRIAEETTIFDEIAVLRQIEGGL
jgi:predicted ester cyclase